MTGNRGVNGKRGEPTREGFSPSQLREAEAELSAGAPAMEVAHSTTMAALVNAWYIADHKREAARLNYGTIVEIRKRGRKVKPDMAVRQYAEAKEQLEVLEDQMLGFLREVGSDDRQDAERLLHGQHYIPGTPVMYRLPQSVRDRIQDQAMPTGLADDDGSAVAGASPAKVSANNEG